MILMTMMTMTTMTVLKQALRQIPPEYNLPRILLLLKKPL